MELYQLKSFVVIAREQNLSRAAEFLHLSQSALSSQMKQLEGALGLLLFRRTARGMELTDGGREMLPLAEGVLETAQRMRLQARALQQGAAESVAIGLNADPNFLRVGAINRRLALLHSELNVYFVTSQTVRTAQLLRQGQLDLAFFYGDTADADIRHLRLERVRICVVIPTPLALPEPPADWPQLAALPWIWGEESPFYAALAEQFAKRRLHPNQAVQTMDEYIVKELAVDGQGLAVMREDEARTLVAEGKGVIWERGWMTVPLSLAWLEKNGEKKRVRLAREAIQHLWQSAGKNEDVQEKYWL
jgi:DNA-binding transcriptional LysR family regulator